jgi:hypothetical protein
MNGVPREAGDAKAEAVEALQQLCRTLDALSSDQHELATAISCCVSAALRFGPSADLACAQLSAAPLALRLTRALHGLLLRVESTRCSLPEEAVLVSLVAQLEAWPTAEQVLAGPPAGEPPAELPGPADAPVEGRELSPELAAARLQYGLNEQLTRMLQELDEVRQPPSHPLAPSALRSHAEARRPRPRRRRAERWHLR